MAGVGLLSAMLFYSYGQIQMVQRRFHADETLSDVFVAGTGAGLFQTILLAPIENVKIRLQAQTDFKHFRGPMHCLSTLYQQFGIRGIYKGMVPTLWRDSWSYGVYFAAYEATKRKFQGEEMTASPSQTFLSGGLAGVISWLLVYPVDVIKSRLQEDSLIQPKYKGMRDCFEQSIKNEGYKVLFRGLSPTLLRTFIVSGANFLVYEMVSKSLS
jgi:solute carrier family 25 carnitine/acylcarnitine transporter 20/29